MTAHRQADPARAQKAPRRTADRRSSGQAAPALGAQGQTQGQTAPGPASRGQFSRRGLMARAAIRSAAASAAALALLGAVNTADAASPSPAA
jgi:hypothetical protein